MAEFKPPVTFEEHKSLYRNDFHDLVEKFGLPEVRRMVEELGAEVLAATKLSEADHTAVVSTWGSAYPQKGGESHG